MKQRNNLSIREIDKTEFNEVAHILTDAFMSNPAYSMIFKNKKHLQEGLLCLFRANLFIHNRNQTLTRVIKDNNSGKIIGTFTLVPPEGVKKDLYGYLALGIPGFIFKFGINSLFRMQVLDSYNKKTITNSIKASKFHYLSMVVIKDEYQGRGIGSFAIKSAIDKLSASNPKIKLIGLTTQLPENVVFYSRLGFEKINEGYINFRNSRYYNYDMRFVMKID